MFTVDGLFIIHGFHMDSLLKPQEQTTIVRAILYLAV